MRLQDLRGDVHPVRAPQATFALSILANGLTTIGPVSSIAPEG